MKEQLKTIIDAFFDDWECPSNNVYSDDLATSLDKAIGIDNIFLSKEELLRAIPIETKYIKSFFPECTCEHDTMGECICYDWNKEFDDYQKAIVDSIFQTQKEKAITKSRPLKCDIEDVAQGRQDRIDMVGFEGTYDALNKLTRRKA